MWRDWVRCPVRTHPGPRGTALELARSYGGYLGLDFDLVGLADGLAGTRTRDIVIRDEQLAKMHFRAVARDTEALSQLRNEVVGGSGEGLGVVGIHGVTWV